MNLSLENACRDGNIEVVNKLVSLCDNINYDSAYSISLENRHNDLANYFIS